MFIPCISSSTDCSSSAFNMGRPWEPKFRQHPQKIVLFWAHASNIQQIWFKFNEVGLFQLYMETQGPLHIESKTLLIELRTQQKQPMTTTTTLHRWSGNFLDWFAFQGHSAMRTLLDCVLWCCFSEKQCFVSPVRASSALILDLWDLFASSCGGWLRTPAMAPTAKTWNLGHTKSMNKNSPYRIHSTWSHRDRCTVRYILPTCFFWVNIPLDGSYQPSAKDQLRLSKWKGEWTCMMQEYRVLKMTPVLRNSLGCTSTLF